MINPRKKKRPYLDYDLEGYIKGQQTARTDATSNQQATTQRQVAENNTSEKVQQRKVANERRKTQEAYEKGKKDYEKQQQAAKVQEDIESRPWWNPTTVLRNAKDIPIFGAAPTATEWAYGLMNKAIGNDVAGDYYMQDADKSATGQAIALAAIPAHTNPYTAAMYDTALLAPWAKELDAQGKFYHPETLTGEEAAMLGLSFLPFGMKYRPQLSYAKTAAEDAALQSSIPWVRDNARGLYLSRAINQAADQGVQAPIKVSRIVERDGTIRMSLPSHTSEQPRQFVIDPQGNNKYYIHMRTWDGKKVPANLSAAEKNALFESVYNELPEGAEILFPKSSEDYLATRGTVAGLQRLSRDKRFNPGQEGTLLYYDDKTGQTKTYTGTSFIKKPQQSATQYVVVEPSVGKVITMKPSYSEEISYERLPYSKYSVDAENAAERESVKKHWMARYPNSKTVFYDEPYKVDDVLAVGELPQSEYSKAIIDVMMRRMQKYPFKEGLDPNYIIGDNLISRHGWAPIKQQLKDSKSILYMPLTKEGNVEGYYVYGDQYLKMNPWRNKNYWYTQIHEGVSHRTDGIVKDMRTPVSNRPLLGNVYKDSSGNTHAEGMYGRISYPEDIFDNTILEQILHKDSKKPIEARSVNWEMITDLYDQLAKSKGITFQEATNLPQEEFQLFVNNTLNTPEKLSNFMKKFNNQYALDYSKLLDMGTPEQSSTYAKRIRGAINSAPVLIPLGGYTLYNILNDNNQQIQVQKNGGKILPPWYK